MVDKLDPVEVAAAVAVVVGRGTWSTRPFLRSLVETVMLADRDERARLGRAYPTVVVMVDKWSANGDAWLMRYLGAE